MRRRLTVVTVSVASLSFLTACGGERASTEVQLAEEVSERVMETAVSTTTRLLEGLEEKRCPRLDHLAVLAEGFSSQLADGLDEIADLAFAEVDDAGTASVLPEAADELADDLRDQAIAAQIDLLKMALEEDCERRQAMLERRALDFKNQAYLHINTFRAQFGLTPFPTH